MVNVAIKLFLVMNRSFKMSKSANEYLVELYLDWVNNFVSVGGFAEYHNISHEDAVTLIDIGEELHEKNCEEKI